MRHPLLFVCCGLLAMRCIDAHAQSTSDYTHNTSQTYYQFDLAPLDVNAPSMSGMVNTGASSATAAVPASGGASGCAGNRNSSGYVVRSSSCLTTKQIAAKLLTQTAQLDKVFGGGTAALPPTRLDSFVRNAGGAADQIYGDEGSSSIPPFFGFETSHRIERGIHSTGLTTGHQSNLPEAWGWPQ